MNGYDSGANTLPPNRLESMAHLLQTSGDPKSRPQNWFLDTGQKKVTIQPDEPKGKWVCTILKKKGVLTTAEFLQLVRAHFFALFIAPNFCYWYYRYGKTLVERAEADAFSWETFPKKMLWALYRTRGFRCALELYGTFCLTLWRQYGAGIPHPEATSFGFMRLLGTRWFWGQAFFWMKRRVS